MQGTEGGADRRRYEARLLDGPLAGTHVQVESRPGGDPQDMLRINGVQRGAYVLAGLSSSGGRLPYRWVTPEEWAGLRRWLRFGRAGRDTP